MIALILIALGAVASTTACQAEHISPKPGGNTMCCRSKGLPDMNDQMDRRSSGHAGERERGVGLKNGCPPGLAKRDNGCVAPGQDPHEMQRTHRPVVR